MFNFMKKSTVLAGGDAVAEERDGEKERRKREKKERKEREKRERIAAGLEEPLRLEEVRRSLKLRGRRKEKEKLPSGITADYTASLFAHLEQDSNYSNYPLISTSGSNSNLSDENNHLSPSYPSHRILQSDSSETSLNSLNNPNNVNTSPRQPPNLPPVPPRPPKRGILKGPRLSNTSSNSQDSNAHNIDTTDYVNGQDTNVLARNTQQNEIISYGIPPSKSTSSSDEMHLMPNFTKKVIHSPIENQYKNYKNSNPTITTQDVDEGPKTNGNSYLGVTSTSPSADSLTDTTTNSSFATPPFSTSPVGESQGFHRWSRTSNFEDVHLPLPSLTPLQLPKPKFLTIQRQKAPRNDFGFSLRRAVIQERVFIGDLNGHEGNGLTNGETKCNGNVGGLTSKLTYKAVILAEPGSYPGASETGLMPGDRLLEVNGVSVEGKSREEVIDLIKGSQESVTVKVQPIAELCELSRRRAADGGGDVDLSDSNVRGGTLSRSGSRRFTNTQVKLAAQVFSRQVATSLEIYMKSLLFLQEEHGYAGCETDIENGLFTAELLLFINNLFDSLNSCGYERGKLQQALSSNSDHLSFWNDAVKKLSAMKFDASDARESHPISLKNFIHDITSIKHLWTDLCKLEGIKFLNLRRLNQDPLENFFGQIRAHGGSNTNPDCTHFVSAYKTLLINSITTGKSLYTNCANDDDKMLGTLTNLTQCNREKASYVDSEELVLNCEVVDSIPQENVLQTQSVSYIAGAVCRALLPKLKCVNCSDCKDALLSTELQPFHSLIAKREYDSEKQHLVYPSKNLNSLVWESIYLIDKFLPDNCYVYIYPKLLETLWKNTNTSWFTCSSHKKDFLTTFFLYVIKMQGKQWCINFNRRIHNIDSRPKAAETENLIKKRVTKGLSYRSTRLRSS